MINTSYGKAFAALALVLAVLGSNSASAQSTITFDAPAPITDASVSTLGKLTYAYIFNGSATVNGVLFQNAGTSGTVNFSQTGLDAGYGAFNDGTGSDLLNDAAYSNNDAPQASLILNSLKSGDIYQVEIFTNDTRTYGNGRYQIFSSQVDEGADNAVGVALDNSANVYYQNAGDTVGDEVIGTFQADDSGSETLYYIGLLDSTAPHGNTAGDQINGFEVRDITDAPEPSTAAGLLVSALAAFVFLGRRVAIRA